MSLPNILKPAVALVLNRILSQIILQVFFAFKWEEKMITHSGGKFPCISLMLANTVQLNLK